MYNVGILTLIYYYVLCEYFYTHIIIYYVGILTLILYIMWVFLHSYYVSILTLLEKEIPMLPLCWFSVKEIEFHFFDSSDLLI